MVAWERELYERFAGYDDEVLLRILTAERAKYRTEALAAAETVLMQRGVALPLVPFDEPEPPAPNVKGQARPKSPYQFIDLCVDLLLFALVYWALTKLHDWTHPPEGVPLGDLIFCALTLGLLGSVFSLRRKWRAKEWRD